MNAAVAKEEIILADESEKTSPNRAASDSIGSPELPDELSSHENTGRELYRRSVAYFFFGFGYDKNAILTDEP